MKSLGVLAGVTFFNAVYKKLGCVVTSSMIKGDTYTAMTVADKGGGGVVKQKVATVTGPCRAILLGERLALNLQ